MRQMLLALILVLIAGSLFAQQFDKVTEGTSRADVVKLLGNPTKKLVSEDKTTECFIWIVKTAAWFIYLKDGKTIGPATNIETMLQGLMDIATDFSNLGTDLEGKPSSNPVEAPIKTTSSDARSATSKDKVQIDVLAAKIIQTWDDKREAGLRFKIKNNSAETIKDLSLTVYFRDQGGKVFFESTYYPVNSSSYMEQTLLKPNYSMLYPEESDQYMTAKGINLEEWVEGDIVVEITGFAIVE
jgi:hypothetical protein